MTQSAVTRANLLQHQFGMTGLLDFSEAENGITKAIATIKDFSAEIFLHGAHVTRWRVRDEDVLFVSSRAEYRDSKAIRGGIPICLPWFGPYKPGQFEATPSKSRQQSDSPKFPSHGFARLAEWQLAATTKSDSAVILVFRLCSSAETKKFFPYDFEANYSVLVGPTLTSTLNMLNCGDVPFRFEQALHHYFRVDDVAQISITGLEGTPYIDKASGFKPVEQNGAIIINEEVDRVYQNPGRDIEIHDPVLNRRIRLATRDSKSIVVWNPWEKTAQGLADLGPGEWKNFVCVETANVQEHGVELQPGAMHSMVCEISLETLQSY